MLTLVDGDSFWVEAYFRETQVHRLAVGDRARCGCWARTGCWRAGWPASPGASPTPTPPPAPIRLPPVSPTFEWVRLAQRIPVRIELGEVPEDLTLVAGMTASVSIGR